MADGYQNKKLMKIQNKIFYIVSLLLLTSCLTIEEDLQINKDGSGKAKIAIKFSDLKENIDKISPEQSDFNFTLLKAKNDSLQHIKGVSNVSMNSNTQFLEFSLKFDFASIQSLNLAMQAIWDIEEDYIKQKGKKITVSPFETVQIKNKVINSQHAEEILGNTHYELKITTESISGVKSELSPVTTDTTLAIKKNLNDLIPSKLSTNFKFF